MRQESVTVVTLDGKSYTIKVDDNPFIDTFNDRIEKATGKSVTGQRLVSIEGSNLKSDVEWNDETVIACVPEESKILFAKGIAGECCIIEFKSEDQISDLRAKIKEVMGYADVTNLVLLLTGNALNDDNTAKQSGIKDGAKLDVLWVLKQETTVQPKQPEPNLTSFLGFAAGAFVGCQLLLPYCATFIRPKAVMPLNISIPVSLLVGVVFGMYMTLADDNPGPGQSRY